MLGNPNEKRHIQTATILVQPKSCENMRLDGERLYHYFQRNGYKLIKNVKKANKIIFITCALSNTATDLSLELTKSLINLDGDLIILGCTPKIALRRLNEIIKGKAMAIKEPKDIDKLFPNFKIKFDDLPDSNRLFKLMEIEKENVLYLTKKFFQRFQLNQSFFQSISYYLKSKFHYNSILLDQRKKAVIRIADGCGNKCSYCVMGTKIRNFRSKPIQVCLEEYKGLLKQKYQRVMFVARDTGAYGIDMGSSFEELLNELSKIQNQKGVKWEIMSLNPMWLIKYKKILNNLIKEGKITHLQIPLQSGSIRILELMNRYPKQEKILKILSNFRKINPELYISTHFIVGFPSETEKEFEDSLKMMTNLKAEEYTVFHYSKMEGTLSSEMSNHVPPQEIRRRMLVVQNRFRKLNYTVFLNKNLYIYK